MPHFAWGHRPPGGRTVHGNRLPASLCWTRAPCSHLGWASTLVTLVAPFRNFLGCFEQKGSKKGKGTGKEGGEGSAADIAALRVNAAAAAAGLVVAVGAGWVALRISKQQIF